MRKTPVKEILRNAKGLINDNVVYDSTLRLSIDKITGYRIEWAELTPIEKRQVAESVMEFAIARERRIRI